MIEMLMIIMEAMMSVNVLVVMTDDVGGEDSSGGDKDGDYCGDDDDHERYVDGEGGDDDGERIGDDVRGGGYGACGDDI
jgi:hypothetical protein